MDNLAAAVIRYRALHNLTQAELAKMCGVDRRRIIDVEKGRSVSALTEEKIKIVLEGKNGMDKRQGVVSRA